MYTNALRIQPSTERLGLYRTDTFRKRALERLYERKAAIDELIESLERYERSTQRPEPRVLEFTGIPRCS